MRRRRFTRFVTALLALTMATLAALGSATPAQAATPALSLDPNYLYLPVEPDSTAETTFNVTGDSNDMIFLYANASWLALNPSDYFFGSRTVRVTASARGLQPGEIRVARITLSGHQTRTYLPVVMVVGGGKTPPTVAVSSDQVDFGTLPVGQEATQYINVAFSAPATATITTDADWIDLSPRSLSAETSVLLTVRPVLSRTRAPQQYAGTIKIQSGSLPPVQIPVTLRTASPEPPPSEDPGPPAQRSFSDVPGNHWARLAIAELAGRGVIAGVGDGSFAPDGNVSREQFAKLLVLALGLPQAPPPYTSPFPDLPAVRWSAGYVIAAQPFMPRYADGLFHPEEPATREEIAMALAQAKGLTPVAKADLSNWFTDDQQIANDAKPWVAAARSAGLIDGFPDRTFRPSAPVTRAQVAVLLERARGICGSAPVRKCGAPLGPEDRTLTGATLVATKGVVEATLGEGSNEKAGFGNSYSLGYRDGQLTVGYVMPSQTVWRVHLRGEGATPRGIKIGDTLDEVRRAYGILPELKNGAITYVAGREYDLFWIRFYIVEGRVHEILLSQSS